MHSTNHTKTWLVVLRLVSYYVLCNEQMGWSGKLRAVCSVLFIVLSIAQSPFQPGRATNYAYSDGACGYKDVYKDESLGDPLHIMAISDCSKYFPKSCGVCYEIKCRNAIITDDNGESIDRTEACYDEDSSVVLRNGDACPAIFPANFESNQRWCSCRSGLEHHDIASEAFTQLAPIGLGVIPTMWRQVACDYQPEKPAPIRDTTVYASPPTTPDQHRTQPDWTGLKASYVTVESDQPLNPYQVATPNIYSSIAGGLLPGWVNSSVHAGNSKMTSPHPVMPPVRTGRGGVGEASCQWVGKGHGVGFSGTDSTAVNTTIVAFWVYTNTTAHLDITIGQHNTNIICDYIELADVPGSSNRSGWVSYTLFVPSFNITSTDKVFNGCNGHPASDFDTVYFLNSKSESTWMCLDDLVWQ